MFKQDSIIIGLFTAVAIATSSAPAIATAVPTSESSAVPEGHISTPITSTNSATNAAPTSEAAPTSPGKPAESTSNGSVDKKWGEPVLNEEFDDSSLSKWNVRDNDYLSYDWAIIKKDNVNVKDGNLTINTQHLDKSAGNKDGHERNYSSGYIDSIGKFSQKYGRFEIRAKLPTTPGKSRGIWPSFWLRPDDTKNGGEIDIFEAYGTPDAVDNFDPANKTEGTVHFVQDTKSNTKKSKFTPDNVNVNDGQFHTWATEWTPDKIVFFVDNQEYHTVNRSDNPEMWDKAFSSGAYNIRINTAVGSKYWGTPNEKDTADRTDYVIDYVRAWKYNNN